MKPGRDPQTLLKLARLCRQQQDTVRARALVEHLLRRHPSPAAWLLRAELAADAGDMPLVEKILPRLERQRWPDPRDRYTFVQLLVKLTRWAEAEALLQGAPETPAWLQLRAEVERALGRVEQVAETRAKLRALRPDDRITLHHQAASLAGRGDPAHALALVSDALRHHPEDRSLRILHLDLLVWLDADGLSEALATWASQAQDLTDRLRLVAWLAHGPSPEDARTLALTLSTETPTSPQPYVWLARLALWSADASAAHIHAADAIERGSGSEAVLIQAAAETLAGRADAALPALTKLCAQRPEDTEVWGWLSEALRQEGRFAEALQAADRAMATSQRFNVTARINRFLSLQEAERQGAQPLDQAHAGAQELLAQLTPLDLDAETVHDLLEAALVRFGGNRSGWITTVADGVLHRYLRPPDPRDLGRQAQKLIFTRGPQAAQARFDALAARFPDHPLVLTYRGELKLWMGDYASAEADFRAALAADPQTKWAWIGLGAVRSVQGNPRAAIETFAEGIHTTNFAGPTLYIYRAEAHLQRGDRAAAVADLREARAVTPRRLSTWIQMARLDLEDGDDTAARALIPKIAAHLPGLYADLGDETAPEQVLAGCLARMGGNRSSSVITWRSPQGKFCAAIWPDLSSVLTEAFSRWRP